MLGEDLISIEYSVIVVSFPEMGLEIQNGERDQNLFSIYNWY